MGFTYEPDLDATVGVPDDRWNAYVATASAICGSIDDPWTRGVRLWRLANCCGAMVLPGDLFGMGRMFDNDKRPAWL